MRFKEVYGQLRLKESLIKAVNGNRLPHALLFHGPQGCGKLAMALALAQYVNCPHRTEVDSCGECPSCIQMQKLVHPDLHFAFPITRSKESITCDNYLAQWRERVLQSPYFDLGQWEQCISQDKKQSMIYANESDEIIKKLSVKSYQSEYKIMVIWLPERMMNDVCANKLLKIIEEPPSKTLFILVSDEAEKLLPTITSRTQRFFVPPLLESDLSDALSKESGIAPDELAYLSHVSNGSLTKAMELHHAYESENENHNLFVQVMRYCYARKVKELKMWAETIGMAGKKEQLSFLRYAQKTVRENFIFNLQVSQLNYQSREEAAFSQKFAPFINERNISGFLSELELSERHVEQNVQAKIVFFDLALKIAVLIRK